MDPSTQIRMELRDAFAALGIIVGVIVCGLMWVAVWIVWTA
jgi:uncharacterized membrane protein YciS (DUF1049 family)